MGAKRLGGKRLGGKRLGGETTRGRNGLRAKRPGFAADKVIVCKPQFYYRKMELGLSEQPLKDHYYKEKLMFKRVYIFSLIILLQNIDCGNCV